jgi:hypothetical protein
LAEIWKKKRPKKNRDEAPISIDYTTHFSQKKNKKSGNLRRNETKNGAFKTKNARAKLRGGSFSGEDLSRLGGSVRASRQDFRAIDRTGLRYAEPLVCETALAKGVDGFCILSERHGEGAAAKVKSSQVNTLPKAKSETRSKQNKDMHKCSSVYSERGVFLPVLTSGGERVGVRACKISTRVPPSLCDVTRTSDPAKGLELSSHTLGLL